MAQDVEKITPQAVEEHEAAHHRRVWLWARILKAAGDIMGLDLMAVRAPTVRPVTRDGGTAQDRVATAGQFQKDYPKTIGEA